MTAVNESDISRLLGPVLASGSERVCVQNLENPLSCFKISKFGPSRQTAREIEYFKFLKKRGVTSSFLPIFYDGYYYNGQLVIEQDLLKTNRRKTFLLSALRSLSGMRQQPNWRNFSAI